MNLLEINELIVSYKFQTRESNRDIYREIQVLNGINLSVSKGEIVAILGPNGAGKSTLMQTIVALNLKLGHKWGEINVRSGKIIFEGRVINELSTAEIVKSGITLVPEGKLLFPSLTVLENLELGAYAVRNKTDGETKKKAWDDVFSIFPDLKSKKKELAKRLSGGQAQMVAVGRGFVSRPKLLLLDEPCLGIAPLLVRDLMKSLSRLREEFGITILIAEQNASAALSITDRAYVLKEGDVVAEGSAQQLQSQDDIRRAYLGA